MTAWSGLWPVAAGDAITIEHLNELRAQLRERTGDEDVLPEEFAAGQEIGAAIDILRGAVGGQIEHFYDGDTGHVYCWDGYVPPPILNDEGINIFVVAFGAGRAAWRNEQDGTESTSGESYHCEKCSLEDSPSYDFLLNELQAIVDLLVWKKVALSLSPAVSYDPPLSPANTKSTGTAEDQSETKQGELDATWADLAAVTPTGDIAGAGYEAVTYLLRPGWGYEMVVLNFCRGIRGAAIPAGTQRLKYVLGPDSYSAEGDVYRRDDGLGGGEYVANPAWTFALYGGTSSSGIWSYGAAVASGLSPGTWTAVADLTTGWTAGSDYYLQMRLTDESAPQRLVDDGYWGPPGDASYMYQLVGHGFLLYSLIAA